MIKSPKGLLLTSDSTEMQVQVHTNTTAGRLVVRDLSIYSIPATHSAGVKISALISSQCREGRGRRGKL
jgi:hypothetical protein